MNQPISLTFSDYPIDTKQRVPTDCSLDCPPKYSWSEIFKHRSDEDLWTVVKGKVYNVTSWITKHPGGSLILNGGGREATAIFLSCHPLRAEKMLKKYEIGEVRDYQTFYEWESDFFSVLKGRVESFMAREGLNESSKVMYVKTLLIFGCWLFLYYWSMIQGYFAAALALGFIHSHLGISIGHDGNHGSYSKSPFLNGLAACIMDFMGVSSTVWLHQHNIGHHPNCNRQEEYCKDGSDQDDPDTHSGSPFLRLAPGQPLMWYHRWQHIYVWFLLCFFAIKWLLDDIRSFVKKRYINVKFFRTGYSSLFFFVLSKLFCIFYLFFIPFHLHSFPRSLLLSFCCLTVTSYMLVLTFSVNHLSGASIFPDNNIPTRDWARLQVETSSNFGVGSAFWTWMSGGLNYQIEHHLFPSICHVHLPRISPIVQQTCREYKIPYHAFPSYLDAFSCFYQSIKHLGNQKPPARKSE